MLRSCHGWPRRTRGGCLHSQFHLHVVCMRPEKPLILVGLFSKVRLQLWSSKPSWKSKRHNGDLIEDAVNNFMEGQCVVLEAVRRETALVDFAVEREQRVDLHSAESGILNAALGKFHTRPREQ